ncbi:MAG: hypothetical protein M3247_03775 [Thermoproteota archaeon]|nr:hypothetical protein [Thermoproteota archaeon]
MSQKQSNSVFFTEVKEQFQREIEFKKTLDDKSSTMVTMASSVSTLLIAIGTFLVTRIEPKVSVFPTSVFLDSIIILSIGIVFSILAAYYFIRAYSLRTYLFPLAKEEFFYTIEKNCERKYKQDAMEKFRTTDSDSVERYMIQEYARCIVDFGAKNEQRSISITWGQTWLIVSVVSVGLLLGFVLISTGLGIIKIQ